MIASTGAPRNRAATVLVTDDAALDAALQALCAKDRLMAELVATTGRPPLRHRPPGFPGLAWVIVAQQLSTASAAAIFGRLAAAFEGPSAAALAGGDDAALRACGLSAGKIRTLRACAEAVATGALDFSVLSREPAEAAHATLCAIKGIGPWTADVFLLFSVGHADAWPAGDLALQEAARLVLARPTRPDARALTAIGERWRPWRGVAARVLWARYGQIKGRTVAPEG